jgi:hypothetical protein
MTWSQCDPEFNGKCIVLVVLRRGTGIGGATKTAWIGMTS